MKIVLIRISSMELWTSGKIQTVDMTLMTWVFLMV